MFYLQNDQVPSTSLCFLLIFTHTLHRHIYIHIRSHARMLACLHNCFKYQNYCRPAMSKHCSSCGGCVARYDHHCIWLRKCVGEKNYLEFLAFLIVHLGLCWYGTYVISMILLGWADATRLWTGMQHQHIHT